MKAKQVLNADTNEIIGYKIICVGCDQEHIVYTKAFNEQHVWGFNGNIENPTFTPSLLIRSGHFIPDFKSNERCWCTYNKECIDKGEEPSSFECKICHSFITDGKIQYLSDCTHSLAGQTIDLPNIEQ